MGYQKRIRDELYLNQKESKSGIFYLQSDGSIGNIEKLQQGSYFYQTPYNPGKSVIENGVGYSSLYPIADGRVIFTIDSYYRYLLRYVDREDPAELKCGRSTYVASLKQLHDISDLKPIYSVNNDCRGFANTVRLYPIHYLNSPATIESAGWVYFTNVEGDLRRVRLVESERGSEEFVHDKSYPLLALSDSKLLIYSKSLADEKPGLLIIAVEN